MNNSASVKKVGNRDDGGDWNDRYGEWELLFPVGEETGELLGIAGGKTATGREKRKRKKVDKSSQAWKWVESSVGIPNGRVEYRQVKSSPRGGGAEPKISLSLDQQHQLRK